MGTMRVVFIVALGMIDEPASRKSTCFALSAEYRPHLQREVPYSAEMEMENGEKWNGVLAIREKQIRDTVAVVT